MKPVFIGGCDRSGTTLLGSMLGAHSDCLTVPEAQFIVSTLAGKDFSSGSPTQLMGVFDAIKASPRFGIWGIEIGSFSELPQHATVSYANLIGWIVQQYGMQYGKASAQLWIDHTPWHIRYAHTLSELFEGAKFIHIVRDGRAVAASLLRMDSGPATIDRAARFWLFQLTYGLAAEPFLGYERIIRVHYEDLIKEPENTLVQICSFLDLVPQVEMGQGSGFQVPEYTKKKHALVGQKPDPERVEAWKHELTPRQIEIFESMTGDMLSYLGYEPLFGTAKRPMTVHDKARSHLGHYRAYLSNFRQRARLMASARKSKHAPSRRVEP